MSVEYDERLLASAPAATRKEKQEGYNIDLLDDGRGGVKSGSSTPPVLAPNENYAENGVRSKEVAADFTNGRSYTNSTTTLWYKTKKGLIILFVVAVVIIAAVVGGAVGGTVGHHKNTDNSAEDGSASSGAEPAPQGGAPPDASIQAGSPSSDGVTLPFTIPTPSPSPSPASSPSPSPSSPLNLGSVPGESGAPDSPDYLQAVSGVAALPP